MKPTTPIALAITLLSASVWADDPPAAATPAPPAAAPPAQTATLPVTPPAAPAPAAASAPPAAATTAAAALREEPAGTGAPDLRLQSGPWSFRPFGFIRAGYENVQKDSRYDFVGRNNGFVFESARLGAEVEHGDELTVRISVEGAAGHPAGINTPSGSLDVKLRDAYGRYDPIRYAGVQVGQFEAPFAAEEMRSTTDLLFASRALGQEGVLPGRGLEQPALALDRQLGVMISPREPVYFGKVGFSTYLALVNGNGANQLVNDDSSPSFIGRMEVYFQRYVRAGGAFLRGSRRAGAPPDLFDEKDTGYAGDLLLNLGELEVFGQFVQIKTAFTTAGGSDRTQRAFSAQAGYRFKLPKYVDVTPAYRFAQMDPWASGDEATDGAALDTFKLVYHTFGVRLEHQRLPLKLFINYTLTGEQAPHELANDRLQILTQAAF